MRAQKPRETRRRYYTAMVKEGNSYRSIAAKVGVTHRTVWQSVNEKRHRMR